MGGRLQTPIALNQHDAVFGESSRSNRVNEERARTSVLTTLRPEMVSRFWPERPFLQCYLLMKTEPKTRSCLQSSITCVLQEQVNGGPKISQISAVKDQIFD